MFTDAQRNIFEYQDWTGAARYCDPVTAWRKLREATGGKYNELVRDMKSPDPAQMSQATEALVKAVAFAFGLPLMNPATGEGWLEADVMRLAERFTDYTAEVKKNTNRSPTFSPPTEG